MKRGIVRRITAKIYHTGSDINLLLKKKFLRGDVKFINIGGGKFVKKGWANLDYDLNKDEVLYKLIDYNIDLNKKTRWKIGRKFDLAYCSQVIEHIPEALIKNLFLNVFNILKDGSTLRIVVPDIDLALLNYKNKNLEWFKSCYGRFVHLPKDENFALEHYLLTIFSTKKREEVDLGEVRKDFKIMQIEDFFKKYSSGYSYKHSNYHVNWFNFEKLKKVLEESGFNNIKKMEHKKSDIEELREKEFDNTIPLMSMFVECKR